MTYDDEPPPEAYDDGSAQVMADAAYADMQAEAEQHEMEAGFAAQAEAEANQPDVTISAVHSRVLDLKSQVGKELVDREKVIDSTPYHNLGVLIKDLQARMEELRAQQEAMLQTVPDSRAALEDAQRELFELMKMEEREVMGDFRMHYSVKSKIDPMDVYRYFGGDTEKFMKVVTISNKSLEDLAKDNESERGVLNLIKKVVTADRIDYKPKP